MELVLVVTQQRSPDDVDFTATVGDGCGRGIEENRVALMLAAILTRAGSFLTLGARRDDN